MKYHPYSRTNWKIRTGLWTGLWTILVSFGSQHLERETIIARAPMLKCSHGNSRSAGSGNDNLFHVQDNGLLSWLSESEELAKWRTVDKAASSVNVCGFRLLLHYSFRCHHMKIYHSLFVLYWSALICWSLNSMYVSYSEYHLLYKTWMLRGSYTKKKMFLAKKLCGTVLAPR